MADPECLSFTALKPKVSDLTLKAIEEMGFETMTEIQAKAIPHVLHGKDVVASAKTGSGKTLAFLVPAIEQLQRLNFSPDQGTGVIVISPTRELSMQTFEVLEALLQYHSHTFACIMGGVNRNTEVKKLKSGISILVATPGRLLDHLQNTPQFTYRNLKCLIIDEADKILDIGFEEDMKKIISVLPKKRQTLLFSATLTEKTTDLISFALKKPFYIGVDDFEDEATVDGLQQGYVICTSDKRFLLLYTLIKRNSKKKVMVFFNSCISVRHHTDFFNFIDMPVMSIHGKQKQNIRTSTFHRFREAKSGILLCTDVAARGLDIPQVDWIIQFDPPDDPKEYIHRVGRTARGKSRIGHALLILRPEERAFLKYLRTARVPIKEYDFAWDKLANVQSLVEQLMQNSEEFRASAKAAFRAYLRSYKAHRLRKVFDINTLDLAAVAKSFGLLDVPYVV